MNHRNVVADNMSLVGSEETEDFERGVRFGTRNDTRDSRARLGFAELGAEENVLCAQASSMFTACFG